MTIPTGNPETEARERYVEQDGQRHADADAWVAAHEDWRPDEWQHTLHGTVRYSWRRWYRPGRMATARARSEMYVLREERADAMEYAAT